MKIKSLSLRLLVGLLAVLLSAATLLVLVAVGAYMYFSPQLPDTEDVGQTRLNEPLRIYTADHHLIGEFGTERRIPVTFDEIPDKLANAFVAAEDDRFWQHAGLDYHGLMRAGINLLTTGRKTQGGSTITMQLARNLYLSGERTYTRKFKEMLIALRLESELSKEEILALYLNRIYMGHRAYGVGAAAQVYYGKPLKELTLAEQAMIAGLPKAPSAFNPIANPKRAKQRRNYVLDRMHKLGYIDDRAWQKARVADITAGKKTGQAGPLRYQAQYVAEMVRQDMEARFGDRAYTGGYNVTTTLHGKRQLAANKALQRGLLKYTARHGWPGAEKSLDDNVVDDKEALQDELDEMPIRGGLVPAVVLKTQGSTVELATSQYGRVTLSAQHIPWLANNQATSQLVKKGDVVRLVNVAAGGKEKQWRMTAIPQVQGALVAMNPHTGAIEALVGGFDFSLSSFNRAVQARRQTGSAFKPFVYSAALDNGYNAATIINDAPIVYHSPGMKKAWRPRNFSGRVHGPTRMRDGLVFSRNLVSIRVLQGIGLDPAIDYISQFGLPRQQMPRNLSLALGTAAYSPLQMAGAFSIFANSGFRVKPHYISKIEDGRGDIVFNANPRLACDDLDECPALEQVDTGDHEPRLAKRVIDEGNAFIMNDILRDVIKRGTGRRAQVLDRKDIAGKTGTTNDEVDSWFPGYTRDLVTVVWAGFDQLKPMGGSEGGAYFALPIWIDFMGTALKGTPEKLPPKPEDIVTLNIDPNTGNRLPEGGGGIAEYFEKGHEPAVETVEPEDGSDSNADVEELF